MNPYDYVKKEPYKLYINGEFVPSASGETFDIINPVNNERFATAYRGGKADVEKAILAARDAFDHGPWGKTTNYQRSQLLLKTRDLMSQRLEEFAALEALDCGKIFTSSLYYEAVKGLDGFEYSAGKARCLEGKVVPVDGEGRYFNYVIWQPQGVVGEILPWNGPLMMGAFKVASILAAGNTVIIKPSSWASLSILAMAELFHEAGFPPGVVNVVTGSGGEVGSALVESPLVDMVSMTGGTETGKKVIADSSKTVKDIALELGGKSPNIVFPDIEWESAVKWTRFGFTLSSGQVCVSGARLILHRSIYDEFLTQLKIECEKMIPGDGFDYEKGVNLPPLIHKQHAAKVWSYIEKGKAEGARLITGGVPYTDPALAKGNFVPPTVFADVTPEMTIFQEEIFGPVLTVTPFETEQEAIDLANGTPFGLAGAVFTNDCRRALRVAEAIKAGQIYVNTYFSKAINESPGAGWKESGLGIAGIQKYMRSKTVFMDMSEGTLPPQ
ncbi:MAG: aldehyde dehydrogenase family protein [Clostridia bacterium]|nr:aldehyde dehydrogenase family protein [Clostridia bacterium]